MKTKTMKALTFKRYGKSPELGFDNVDYPAPNADEMLVKVYAVGLNPIDNIIPTGIFKPVLHFKLPATLGSDLSGVVVAVGSRVTRFTPGDEIFASIFDKETGSLAEFAVVPESAAGRMTMQVISAVAEFERDLLLERTHSGIARAKASGKRFGRPSALSEDQKRAAMERLNAGSCVSAVAREFNTTRQTILRVKAAFST
ncbi:alcohol dehydrogenase catalytic domain-containing protein [Yersinia frederiksenii]|uniref:alcohol dehydrogenase catalytic domain-containing protein n=1 Tax=Yersinia frederiksenii TaxID=29484 RepID=UPI0005E990E2|nr:helix-turn-helix domain-containing protein [Yersinia frederiksenii]CNL56478.1 transposon resolvase [Yersinia frederiksenii]